MHRFKNPSLLLYISAAFIILLALFAIFRDNAHSITLREATELLEGSSVKKVIATKEYVYLKADDEIYKIASSQVTPKMFVDYHVEIGDGSNTLLSILFLIIILGVGSIIYRFFQKKGSFHPFEPKRATDSLMPSSGVVEAIKSDVSFNDIGGISEVKIELEEIIDFLKNPKRYKNFGARMPRGVLLVGPPGVGKTMIAKAVANAAGVPFYYQSGASFVQIYVGMGAKRVHDLFIAAKNNSPSIIFIDEIDAVGKRRDGQRNDEREATLNQLLTEMDGFEGSNNVIVIAATNKIEVLDEALLRAGRFDRRIFVELPTKKERESILEKYLKNVPNSVDLKEIANMCVGFNGASLAALVNEAALLCLRQNEFQVTLEHFHQVKEKVMFGKKKLQILTETQKRYQVSYQSAKVLVAAYYDLPFEKLMLSNDHLTPASDTALLKHELIHRLKMLIAGIVACEMKFREHSSSAKSDLDEAKELLKRMIEEYGMGRSLIASNGELESLLKIYQEETRALLESLQKPLERVEMILYERESVTKNEVVKFLDEVL